MRADELAKQYAMDPHVEGGAFLENNYLSGEEGRPSSGSIYYYLPPDEISLFHRLDCDEYWCYIAGTPLEIWIVEEDGTLRKELLGSGQGKEPLVYLRKGWLFAAKHNDNREDGTFLSCITVPRFTYEHYVLLTQEETVRQYPSTKEFWN